MTNFGFKTGNKILIKVKDCKYIGTLLAEFMTFNPTVAVLLTDS